MENRENGSDEIKTENKRSKIRFCLIPDYVSVEHSLPEDEKTVIVADGRKISEKLKKYDFFDSRNPGSRLVLMNMIPDIEKVTVISPEISFYRKLSEFDDDDFYTDLILRVLMKGADVEVLSGLIRERIPMPAAGWIKAAAGMGVRLHYLKDKNPASSGKKLLLPGDVAKCGHTGGREILTAPGAVITPGAVDEARKLGVSIIRNTGGQL